MRVLVTGGAGFIGSHVVDVLLAAGIQVRVLDALLPDVHRRARGPEAPGSDTSGTSDADLASLAGLAGLDPRAQLQVGDVRDAETVRAALDGVDAVCHQAAMVGMGVDLADLPAYVAHNDLGTAVLLAEMARAGLHRLVLASSMVVYGEGAYRCPAHGPVRPRPRQEPDLAAGRFDPRCPTCGQPVEPRPVTEDAPMDPRSVYAATKLAQENLAAAWAAASGGTVIALRYHNVYGPRMPRDTPYAGVASLFRSALERGGRPAVFEDGGQLRDFVHVTDVARANLLALRWPEAPARRLSAFNIGSGRPHSVGEMARALCTAFGAQPPRITGEFRAGDVRHVFASSARAGQALGYTATVGFGPGIAEFAHAPLRA
ncbi:NAD-dependent epimerase/dehydratase family protein [Frankia sp. Ag45/Mut15]|uniref:UDP-glucose 4-epimerase n=1 Tax=Frankia umida TaxID=573489 RepID=A0ABT0K4U6_9ACTN|nr:NAD-dependent epimerase/dehydratase family protein [Frankia umida]MCK9878824.1 NAD-dependent epimerase/dehydratase family protein [Frankia umida]